MGYPLILNKNDYLPEIGYFKFTLPIFNTIDKGLFKENTITALE